MAVCIPRPDRWTNTRKPPAGEAPDGPQMRWSYCPTCAGQGRIWSLDLRSASYCWQCLGVGQIGELVE